MLAFLSITSFFSSAGPPPLPMAPPPLPQPAAAFINGAPSASSAPTPSPPLGMQNRGKKRAYDADQKRAYLEKLAAERRVLLHHGGAEGVGAHAAGVPSVDMCAVLKVAFDVPLGGGVRPKGSKQLSFSMDVLAWLLGRTQTHDGLADCYTQADVWSLLLRGLYRYYKAAGEI